MTDLFPSKNRPRALADSPIDSKLILMTTICIVILWIFMAPRPAHAQRCPAGADAFQNCLPLDHRYGGPGEIQRWRPTPETGRSHDISKPSFQKCMLHLDPATCRRLWSR